MKIMIKTLIAGVSLGTIIGCGGQNAATQGTVDLVPKGQVAVGASGSRPPDSVVKIHPGESWYRFRGDWLGMSASDARDRDSSITTDGPPKGFWDEQVAVESAGLWSGLCNDCHGGRRRVTDAKMIPPPPEGWGTGEGLFFGRSRSRADVFRVIHGGGAPSKDSKVPTMPGWGDKLSREQIWGMMYFIEYFSGGIEGQFPPGLYPKQQN